MWGDRVKQRDFLRNIIRSVNIRFFNIFLRLAERLFCIRKCCMCSISSLAVHCNNSCSFFLVICKE